MLNYQFSNLCGIIYNAGNILFTKDESDMILSPVGNKITCFDLKNGVSNTLPIECRSNIKYIDITPDNKILVAVDIDGYCILINLPKKIIIGHFNFRSNVSKIKISPNGKFLAAACNKSLKIFEMPSLLKEYEPLVLYKNYTHWQNDTITSISWSSDSRFVLTGSKDTTVRLLNLFKIKDYVPFMFSGHKKKIVNAMFSEDNKRIFSVSKDGTLFVWKYIDEKSDDFVSKNMFERKIKSNRNLKSTDEILQEKTGLTDDKEEQEESRDLELENYSEFEMLIQKGRYILEKKQQFIVNGKISICDINTKSNILVFGLTTGIFSIYDINTFENKYTLQITDNKINSLSINNNGLWLAFGSKKLGQLLVWEWKSETYIFKQQGHSFDVSCITYSPDGSLLASGGQDGKIKVWDTTNATCIVTFTEHTSKITGIKFIPNKSNVLLSSSLDGTVRAYDLVKYRNFRIMTTPKLCQFLCIAVDFSGEIVCAGSMDPYSIYVWSLKTGDLVDILTGHTGPVSCLAYSRVKDMLVSGSWDKTAKLWELYSKKGTAETFEHNSEVVCVDISPDDKEIVTSVLNGELHTWDISTGSVKNIIDCTRDIWGGRLNEDKFAAKNASKNKYFSSINYNLSGNFILAGGNSPYVCLYDINYQILIKKYCLTHNRSMDGILYKLNSKNLREGEKADLLGYEDSPDSEDEYERDNLLSKLPGAKNLAKQGKKFNVEMKIVAVEFSQTNRSWAVGTTEGIYIYSLDTSLSFSSLQLDLNITTKTAEEEFSKGSYLKALIFSIYLNKADLINKYIDYIPHNQISLLATKLPFNVVGPLLDYLAKKLETDNNLHLYLIWVFNIIKFNGENLKRVKNRNLFLNLNKSLQRSMKGLTNLVEENIFNIKYITENESNNDTNSVMNWDEETADN
jgi:periodic tryptophan protein 2